MTCTDFFYHQHLGKTAAQATGLAYIFRFVFFFFLGCYGKDLGSWPKMKGTYEDKYVYVCQYPWVTESAFVRHTIAGR